MSGPKRRRTEYASSAIEDAAPQIAADIDTEINIRARLAQTLQARIEWAIALKAVLEHGSRGHRTTPESFQQLASEALINAERPAQALFADPYAVVPGLSPPPSAVQTQVPYRRPPPRDKAHVPKGKPTFLYVHAHAIGRPEPEAGPYFLLRCPVCSRTAFSSLQGLLNHARISHAIEWGTHDACIKACAVEERDLDVDLGSEVGIGPSGIRPGLQGIFERAVGVGEEFQNTTGSYMRPDDSESQSVGISVSHDLGLHEETPALAPFLGKEVRRREIKVQDEDVDMDTIPKTKHRAIWKMNFAPRHQPLSDHEANGIEDTRNVEKANHAPAMPVPRPLATPVLVPSSKSRFHFSARVTVSDRSLFVGKVTTPEGPFSRKWMIAVESPSYAVPISSVLKYVKVVPISGLEGTMPCSCYLPVPIAREPPFVVLGMADSPFLARVELAFNGTEEDEGRGGASVAQDVQTTVLEHWVDVDPMKSSSVVAGGEQLLDAELDLRTKVNPVVSSTISLESRRLWNDPIRLPLHTPQILDDGRREGLSLEYRLFSETAKSFPLVLQERDRSQNEPHVPYRLVSSRTQFNQLVLGRQQAIKFRRARAVRDSYLDALQAANLVVPELSVADIYRWLGDPSWQSRKVQLPHNAPANGSTKFSNTEALDKATSWCAHCGFHEKVHPPVETLQSQANGSVSEKNHTDRELNASCTLLHGVDSQLHTSASSSLPRRKLTGENSIPATKPLTHQVEPAESQNPNRKLLQSANPGLLSLVEQIVRSAHIPTFYSPSTTDRRDCRYPIDGCGSTRGEVEAGLAPFAVLAQAAQQFLEEVVGKGVKLATLEKAAVLRTLASRRGGRRHGDSRSDKATHSLLTPRHILQGMRSDLDSGSGSVSTAG